MSLLLTVALAASSASLPTCSWDHPGAGAYVGSMAAAVDRYTDIPQPVREALKARMAKHQYDEIAAIRRDSITGRSRYAPELRQMHFGAGQVCGTVTRSRWADSAVERGLVYCESGQCLIVPTVCRNVSRVTRLGPAEAVGVDKDAAPGAPGADPTPRVVASASNPAPELQFEPPGAGPSFTDQADPSAKPEALSSNAAPQSYAAAGSGLGGGFGGPGSVGDGGGGTPAAPGEPPARPDDAAAPPFPLTSPNGGIGEGGICCAAGGPLPAVPEPASAVLTAFGLLGLVVAVRRRRRH